MAGAAGGTAPGATISGGLSAERESGESSFGTPIAPVGSSTSTSGGGGGGGGSGSVARAARCGIAASMRCSRGWFCAMAMRVASGW